MIKKRPCMNVQIRVVQQDLQCQLDDKSVIICYEFCDPIPTVLCPNPVPACHHNQHYFNSWVDRYDESAGWNLTTTVSLYQENLKKCASNDR